MHNNNNVYNVLTGVSPILNFFCFFIYSNVRTLLFYPIVPDNSRPNNSIIPPITPINMLPSSKFGVKKIIS